MCGRHPIVKRKVVESHQSHSQTNMPMVTCRARGRSPTGRAWLTTSIRTALRTATLEVRVRSRLSDSTGATSSLTMSPGRGPLFPDSRRLCEPNFLLFFVPLLTICCKIRRMLTVHLPVLIKKIPPKKIEHWAY